jgi:predicted  nucleic acid-binding Zn-ribbon protein
MKPCLKCGKVFMAQSQFNRLCPRCAEANQHAYVPRVYIEPQLESRTDENLPRELLNYRS